MTDDPRSPLMRELDELGVWTRQRPGADFTAQVLARAGTESRGTRWRVAAVAAAAVVLASCLGWWMASSTGAVSGELVAHARESVDLAERTRVVAEPGTSLAWREEGGRLVVEQPRGEAFYRVDPGDGPLEVHTPAGEVRVTGTCFSVLVEVPHDMPKKLKSMAGGAVVALAATVVVYEGSTVLTNDAGAVELQAGQRGRALPGVAPTSSPRAVEDDEQAPDQAAFVDRSEIRRQAAEITRLRQQLDESNAQEPTHESSDERPRFSSMGPPIPDGFDHYAPTPDALAEMAECGIVAWDQPPVWADDDQPDPQYLDALDLDAEERAAFVEVFDGFRAETIASARSAYVELGGKPAIADDIDPSELIGIVYGKTSLDAREEARIAIAMERAGLAQPPTGDLSVSERFLRWDADLGNAFERAVAERFGAERAQQIRATRKGWPGKRTTWADLCSERK